MYQVISIKDPFSPLAAFSSLSLLKQWAECAGVDLTASGFGGYRLTAPGLEPGVIVTAPKERK